MPKELTVDIQPNCVKREDPTHKLEWAQCKATAERGFTEILTKHLKKVADETNDELRHQANQAYRRTKKIQGKQPVKKEAQTEAKKAKKQKQ